jgi:hypothetical protein
MATVQNSEVMPHKLKVRNVYTVVINRASKGPIIIIIIIIIIRNNTDNNNKVHGGTHQEIPRILRNVKVH